MARLLAGLLDLLIVSLAAALLAAPFILILGAPLIALG